MHDIILYTNILNNKIYNIYDELYKLNLIKTPIIFTNKSNILIDKNICIFHTKYIFNQHYDIILSDSSATNFLSKRCSKLITYYNNTINDIISKIGEK